VTFQTEFPKPNTYSCRCNNQCWLKLKVCVSNYFHSFKSSDWNLLHMIA